MYKEKIILDITTKIYGPTGQQALVDEVNGLFNLLSYETPIHILIETKED